MKTVISWIIAIVLGFLLIHIAIWIIGQTIKLIFDLFVILVALAIAIPIFLYIKKKFFPERRY